MRSAGWAIGLMCVACGSATTSDAGPDACSDDSECDDALFCTGVERCGADGCVSPGSPCGADFCDEATDACVSPCERDQDGDGQDSIACGGVDCDDLDPSRAQGNAEICDAEGVDEDCDRATIGPDGDGDGYVRAGCCNEQSGGDLLCGDDCEDNNVNVAPGAPELCDGRDNDCLNGLDFPGEDNDRDGWADCVDLPSAMRDCVDTDDTIYPGAPELCDAVEHDCMGAPEDDDGDGHAPPGVCEGGFPADDCDGDEWRAFSGAPEICDGVDNDCDGTTDDACGPTCDAPGEASFASARFLFDTVAMCYPECGTDLACASRCVAGDAAAGTECTLCANVLTRCGAASAALGCVDGFDESCRRGICSACLADVGDCTGVRMSDCGCADAGNLDDALGAFAVCQRATCTTPECVASCVNAEVGFGMGCASCFGDLLACQRSGCAAPCADPRSHDCRACLDANCVAGLETCAGATFAPAACTRTESTRLLQPAVRSAIRSCGGTCFNRSCAVDCAHAGASPTVLSDACADCYGVVFDCAVRECRSECTSGDAALCDSCVCSRCQEEAIACAGFGDVCP